MAYPTIPDLVVRDEDLYTVYADDAAGGSLVLLGQIENISWNSQADNRRYTRVSTGGTDVAGDIQHGVTMRVYVETDMNEVGRVLGFPRGTAWSTATTTKIKLNTSKVIDLRIDGYSDTSATGSVVHQYIISNFSPRAFQGGLQSNNPHLIEVRGIASDIEADPVTPFS